jgi:hypothetical protein
MKFIAAAAVMMTIAGCPSGRNADDVARKLDAEFRANVPNGSSKQIVIDFLRTRSIAYHDESKLKLITASIPDIEKGTLTRSGVYMQFRFDAQDRLANHEIKARSTGL